LSGFTGTIQFDISANSSNYWFGPEYDLSGQPFLADLSHARVVLSGQGKSSAPLDPRLGAGDGVYGTVRIGELSGTGGILRGGFNAQGPLLFEVGALNTNSTFGGRIANYDGGGVVSLTKVGSGILSLAGSGNDFTGATTINAGILEVAPGGSFGAGTVTIANSAVLSFLGSSFALPRVAGTGTIFLNSATLTLGNSSISSFAGAITGSGTLLKNGTLTLSGNSTYTGTTLVNSSLLIVASSGALGASTLTLNRAPVNNPAKVQLNDGINVPNNIILNDSSSQFGNAIIDLASNARATLSGNISATGTSNQYRIGSTNGTLTLTGASTAGTPTNAVAGTTFWNNGSSNLTNQPSSKVVFAGTASLTSWQTPIGIHASNVLLQDNASFTVAGTVSAAGFYMGMGAFFSNYQGPTILTLQDNAVINLGARTFDLQNNPSYSNSTVNLNGGSLVLGRFIRSFNGTGFLSGTINFNGTMIVAAQNATSFLPSFTSTIQTAIVKTGGARINPNNFAITALLPLIHDPALGAAADGGLLVAGAGTLVLASANTYTGPTTISAGVLQLGTGGTIGSFASGTVLNNGTLAFNRSNALTLNNSISGTGGLSQIGPGTTTLAGGYTATGPINVSAGKLLFAETSGLRQTSAVLLASAGVNVANTNSVLDLTNHDLMITYNNASSSSYIINTLWENGTALLLGAGDPSGPRITSSTANNNTSSFPTFIVAFDIDSLFGGGISGDGSGVGSNYGSYTDNLVVTQPGTIMFKYGYYADIDFSGKVDAGDINLVLGSLGQTTPGLADPGLSYLLGDVDYSGKVDAGDINLVLGMLGAGNGTTGGNPLGIIESSAVAGVAWNVPEPATLVLLTLGALIVVPRPRRGR
jgi:autotransporter-associated beta strand protein